MSDLLYIDKTVSTAEALADVRRHQWESDPPEAVDQ